MLQLPVTRKQNPPRLVLGFLAIAGIAGYVLWQANKARKAKAAGGGEAPGKNWGPLYDTYALSGEGSASYQVVLPTGSHIRTTMMDVPSAGYFWQANVLSGAGQVEAALERDNGNVVGRIRGKSAGPAKVVFSLIGPNQELAASHSFEVTVE
jgi:hypothetical protein